MPIKVRKELVELASKMIRYGIARSRSHAFNIMIERGLKEVLKEVRFWTKYMRKLRNLKRRIIKLGMVALRSY